jgi:hypothetical protein
MQPANGSTQLAARYHPQEEKLALKVRSELDEGGGKVCGLIGRVCFAQVVIVTIISPPHPSAAFSRLWMGTYV